MGMDRQFNPTLSYNVITYDAGIKGLKLIQAVKRAQVHNWVSLYHWIPKHGGNHIIVPVATK